MEIHKEVMDLYDNVLITQTPCPYTIWLFLVLIYDIVMMEAEAGEIEISVDLILKVHY